MNTSIDRGAITACGGLKPVALGAAHGRLRELAVAKAKGRVRQRVKWKTAMNLAVAGETGESVKQLRGLVKRKFDSHAGNIPGDILRPREEVIVTVIGGVGFEETSGGLNPFMREHSRIEQTGTRIGERFDHIASGTPITT